MTYSKDTTTRFELDTLTVYAEKGKLKIRFSRKFFNSSNPVRKALGIGDTPDGIAKARVTCRQLDNEIQQGKLTIANLDGSEVFNEVRFNEILKENGCRANLKIITGGVQLSSDPTPPKPKLSILEVWDSYIEASSRNWSPTYRKLDIEGTATNFIKAALAAVGDNPYSMRDWLLTNRSTIKTIRVLKSLAAAFDIAIKKDLYHDKNPFDGVCEGIALKDKSKVVSRDDNEDNDLLDKNKSFTHNETEVILDFIKNHPNKKFNQYYHFIAFKFLTGCRQGEAAGMWWRDIKWDKQEVIIARAYSSRINIFKPTKNGRIRRFPMPKDGKLWNLLKEMEQGKPTDSIFSINKKPINSNVFGRVWNHKVLEGKNYLGIIPQLIEQGKVSKYLPPYNTRHTFITHQIFDLGRDPAIVAAWCEHSESVSQKHYQDVKRIALGINPELPVINAQQEKVEDEMEALRQENRELKEMLKAIMAKLDSK